MDGLESATTPHSVIAQLVGDLVVGEVDHGNLPAAELVHELQAEPFPSGGRFDPRV